MSALNRLAGGVAHDFNNLLTTILTSVDMLEGTLEAEHVGRHDAQEIRRAARRAAELTRQLLALSQQQVLVQRPVDLNPVVQRAIASVRRATSQRVDVRVMLASLPVIASVDSEELEQVLINLAAFSSESMQDAGMMRWSVGVCSLNNGQFGEPDSVAPGEYVTITFEDTGPSFPMDAIAHLFEPFYGVELAGSVSGLALATLHGFVRQSGGSVVLEQVAIGRRLVMYFPVATLPPAKSSRAAEGVSHRATVLLAEDEPTVRLLMKRVLQRAGYAVLVASNGEEALALSRSYAGHIDLLVTDVIMPGMGGGELSRRLRTEQPHIKVLHVSGYTAGALRQHEALEDGAAFLQKPFSPKVLAARVQEILSGERVG
jgi:CheY-like chemotaxis protein